MVLTLMCIVNTCVWCSRRRREVAGGEERSEPKAVKLLFGLTGLAIKQTNIQAYLIFDICHIFRSARTSYRTFDFRPSVRPPVRAKNPDHLYSLINHRRTTVNLSNHIFSESW